MNFGIRNVILGAAFLSAALAQVSFRPADGKIEVRVQGQAFSNLYFGPDWPQPFLHPLRAASGLAVTRGYPVEKIEGESQDHIWHHGLWYAHGDINGVDFWRDKGPQVTGRIVPKRAPRVSGNAVAGEFELSAPGGKILGSMRQEFRFAARGSLRVVDVRVAILADRGVALKFGDTEEGALGLRMRDEFREDRGALITNSEGLSGTKAVWGKRAAWVDYTTTVGGEKAGITMIDHPGNPKHPAFWHARNYGLCAANPFGERDFMRDKTRDGSLTIPAGETATFRYRVVVHGGERTPAEAARWLNEFAREK